ncbi:MAG: tRNA uridine-5-carboxymethylaminomethyl(34) synthesis GTPase MnmE, partial [Pseudomonadales bacterium]
MTDTIVAIATPAGRGGVGVVRVSGKNVGQIAAAVVGRLPQPRYATLCTFTDHDGSVIDSGIALYFPAPRSFTGEDVLELQGHGGPVVLDLLLKRVVSCGARIARPG